MLNFNCFVSCDKMNILRCSTTYGGYVNVSYFNQYMIQLMIKSNSKKIWIVRLQPVYDTIDDKI